MRKITNDLILLLALLVFGLMLILPAMAKGAEPDEVATLRAELAKAQAEIHKLKYANLLPIENQIKPIPDNWKEAYGDSETTQFYFNIRTALIDFEKCKSDIMLLVSVINGITDPNDPNSLAARVTEMYGSIPGDQFMTYNKHQKFNHNKDKYIEHLVERLYGKLDHSECKLDKHGICWTTDGCVALKEDDPNEVRL